MAKKGLAIGAAAKRTGMPVKTLRFYSDEGIVPASGRTPSGYRVYDEADLAKLDLVRTLREAGLGLAAIRAVLHRDLKLADALRLRLSAVEAHITSLRQIAAALRAALRSEPTEHDIRRLCAVTHLSHEERKAVIERFYEKVSEGIPIDKPWMQKMIQESTPKLPEDPTPDQLDAWVELSELVADPAFIASLRANAQEVWSRNIDVSAMQSANTAAETAAGEARARNVTPTSEEARPVVEALLEGLARVMGRDAHSAAFRAGVRERFARQDPRATRYWELVGILAGRAPVSARSENWRWLVTATLHHLAPPAG